ncbi:type IX secretion system plug protein domain-containing protein, partial [Ornithobacterium rhinotracheale]
ATAWAQLKTIQLFNPQTNDHTPVVKIGENLIFSFDDLNQNYQNYDYKIVRYNRNWEPSTAFVSEFLEGAQRNRFRNYKSSFNT